MMNDNQMPNGGFGVSQGNQQPSGPSVLPTPGSMPITQQETPIVKPNINVQGGGKSDGGGGIFGSLGGIVGKGIGALLGGLFSQGGYVGDSRNGFAQGGSTTPKEDSMVYGQDRFLEPPGASQQAQNPNNEALALGYLIGAYHQQNYGGTPDSLPKAAEEFKQLLMSNEQGMSEGGMSSGGPVEDDPLLANQAMNETMGLNQTAPQQSVPPVPMGAAPGSQGASLLGQQRGYAAGGPPMPMAPPQGTTGPGASPPPLQPGEAFQGDGSVKGPGGPTDDAIPAKLSNGEFVMSAAATQFFGVDKLVQMNEKGKQGFMQAINQVEENQGQAPGGPPGQPPMAPPGGAMPPGAPPMPPMGGPPGMMQRPIPGSGGKPPMMQKSGGPAMRPKSSGYCGM